MMAAIRAGLAGVTRSEVTGQQVSRDHFPRTFPPHLAAAGDPDDLGGAGEGQAPGHRGDLQCAAPGAAMAAFPLAAGRRHVAPGHSGELGAQAGLVALDDQQVARAALAQAGGVAVLGVQGIGGDDGPCAAHPVRQRGEHGNSAGPGSRLHLARHRAMGMIERRQQAAAALPARPGAA
jgi:hypothetical protein